jgi:hypothetical protein
MVIGLIFSPRNINTEGILITLFYVSFYYVTIRTIIGLFLKDKYAKIHRILVLIAWMIGGGYMYMLQYT